MIRNFVGCLVANVDFYEKSTKTRLTPLKTEGRLKKLRTYQLQRGKNAVSKWQGACFTLP